MAERPTQARLNGERVVGVDSAGAIAVVVGLADAPSPLWGDLLAGLADRPTAITRVEVRGSEGSPAEPPTQIEVRVSSPDGIREALDWLVGAIAQTNERHDAQRHRLAAIYQEALGQVDGWYEDARASGAARQDPTLS